MRQQLLNQNEGFKTTTSYSGKNRSEGRTYEIQDGELHIRARGRSSWADGHYDQEFIADDGRTRRFLKDNLKRPEH
jgi:hypothetical protein